MSTSDSPSGPQRPRHGYAQCCIYSTLHNNVEYDDIFDVGLYITLRTLTWTNWQIFRKLIERLYFYIWSAIWIKWIRCKNFYKNAGDDALNAPMLCAARHNHADNRGKHAPGSLTMRVEPVVISNCTNSLRISSSFSGTSRPTYAYIAAEEQKSLAAVYMDDRASWNVQRSMWSILRRHTAVDTPARLMTSIEKRL